MSLTALLFFGWQNRVELLAPNGVRKQDLGAISHIKPKHRPCRQSQVDVSYQQRLLLEFGLRMDATVRRNHH